MEEQDIAGFDCEAQTLHCSNVVNNQILQITQNSVRLVDGATLKLNASWTAEDSKQV